MAGEIGYSRDLPLAKEGGPGTPGGKVSGLAPQQAVKLLSLRVPERPSPTAIAPLPLLQSDGSAGAGAVNGGALLQQALRRVFGIGAPGSGGVVLDTGHIGGGSGRGSALGAVVGGLAGNDRGPTVRLPGQAIGGQDGSPPPSRPGPPRIGVHDEIPTGDLPLPNPPPAAPEPPPRPLDIHGLPISDDLGPLSPYERIHGRFGPPTPLDFGDSF
jgi:hypothetical protein